MKLAACKYGCVYMFQVYRLVQVASRQRFIETQNNKSLSSQAAIVPLASLDIVYNGFLVSACVVSLLETVRLAYTVHMMADHIDRCVTITSLRSPTCLHSSQVEYRSS